MTSDKLDEYRERAECARVEQDFEAAGQYYTLASYEGLGACNYQRLDAITSGTTLGLTMYCLQQAAIHFRIKGNAARSANRVRQGVLIAEDFEAYVFENSALKGLAQEWIGDLRTIGECKDADQAYEEAIRRYQEVEEQSGWASEPIFEWSFRSRLEVAAAIEENISAETRKEAQTDLEDRINVKRSGFALALRRLESSSTYPILE